MTILLPIDRKITLEDSLSNIDRTKLMKALDRMKDLTPKKIELHFPKFKIDRSVDLMDSMIGSELPTAANPQKADFGHMVAAGKLIPNIFIKNFFHQAVVAVDEKGTEAAAASAALMAFGGGFGESPRILKVDRPFIFLIRDIWTKQTYFIGKVYDPRSR